MLLALAICNLFVLTIANPFHKYPFVFLLDVGNEELQKTNTEQIRISVPGGSIAIRYPAIGEGETIAHVRVSGIDFGTDLKATIIDGGLGSKYVVLVFMGNSGVPYDAVITVQTVCNDKFDLNTKNIGNSVNYESEENDSNNSAEDFNDNTDVLESPDQVYIEKNNAELTQSSSNMYAYTYNKVVNSESSNEGHDFKVEDDIKNHQESYGQDDSIRKMNYIEDEEEPDEINISRVELPNSESENDDDGQAIAKDSLVVQDKSSDTFDDSDEDTQLELQVNNRADYNGDIVGYEDQDKIREVEGQIEQMFNDEETHYDADKLKDSNNNDDYDNGDSFAVVS